MSAWKAPDAEPLQLTGSKAEAIAMVKDPSLRLTAEDTLAGEINAHGATGVPLCSILSGNNELDEQSVRTALEQGGFSQSGYVSSMPRY